MSAASMGGENAQQIQLQDPDDVPEQPQLTILVALLTLGISTALVAVCAEFMVCSSVVWFIDMELMEWNRLTPLMR